MYSQNVFSGGYSFTPKNISLKPNVAAFDLDDTLCARYKTDLMPYVKDTINEEFQKKYLIVIFTNQSGKNGYPSNMLQRIKSLPFPAIVYVSVDYSRSRKPRIGMFEEFMKQMNDAGNEISLKDSFYVGDAAGRPDDFSESDIKFARNIGVSFKTPQEFFGYLPITTSNKNITGVFNVNIKKGGKFRNIYSDMKTKSLLEAVQRKYASGKQINIVVKDEDPTDVIAAIKDFSFETNWGFYPEKYLLSENIISKKKEYLETKLKNVGDFVIMCGLPGSGKSTFCRKYLKSHTLISNDLKNTNMEILRKIIPKSPIVFDNVHRDDASRKEVVALAEEFGKTPCYILMDTPIELVEKLNGLRKGKEIVSNIAINTHKKYFSMPPKEKTIIVEFIPDFTEEELEEFLQY